MGSSPYQLLQVLSSPNSRLLFNYRKCQEDDNEFMINERHLRLLKHTADMTSVSFLEKTIPKAKYKKKRQVYSMEILKYCVKVSATRNTFSKDIQS